MRRGRSIAALAGLVLALALATAAVAQTPHDVEVVDNDFEPETITITAGDTVDWTHTGANPHTVTASDGSFDSNPDCNGFADASGGNCMASGDTFEMTFDEPGTYAYYCKLHGTPEGSGMAGTVVVEAAQTDGGTTTDGGDTTTDGGDTTTDGGDTTTDGGDTTTDGGDTTGGSAEEPEVTGSIMVSDQSGDGSTVTVDSVTITGASGFVVIHADGGGQPGEVIGHEPIPEGTSTDVAVTLDATLTADATVWPMLHVDAGTIGTYEFPGADGPVMNADGVVVEPLELTVQGAAADDALPETGVTRGVALAFLAAGIAIVGGAFVLRRA